METVERGVDVCLTFERLADPPQERRGQDSILRAAQPVQRALEKRARVIEAPLRVSGVRLLDENVNRRLCRHAAAM